MSGAADIDAEALRAEIRRLAPWHHDVEIAPGVRTGDPLPPNTASPELGTPALIPADRDMAGLAADLFPDGFAGRSILDCGCNAGGYLFAARALGAGRGFGFDARDHWIRQARFLARHLSGDGLEFSTCELDALPGLELEPFDFTLFKGLFYHLPDPVAGLRTVADLTREIIVVNTLARFGRGDALALKPESRTLAMSGVDGLAWAPTSVRVLQEILAWCGFPHSRLRWAMRLQRRDWRMEIVAARDAAALTHYDTRPHPRPPGRFACAAARLLGRPPELFFRRAAGAFR